MITKDEYLKALELIDKYHVQQKENRNKTLVVDWDKLKFCSIRLKNVLFNKHEGRFGNKIIYIEDITKRNFLKQRGAGRKSFVEFDELGGFELGKNKKL